MSDLVKIIFMTKSIVLTVWPLEGGPTAAVIALQNPSIRVTVVDKDAKRIAKWTSRHLPVHEPGLYDVVRSARDGTRATQLVMDDSTGGHANLSARAPNLFFTTEVEQTIAEADLIFLAVNTPTKTYGIGAGQATNIAALEGATRTIAQSAKPGAIIVEKSTVPCRTGQTIRETVGHFTPREETLLISCSLNSIALGCRSRSFPIPNFLRKVQPSRISCTPIEYS
jgi:UDPglucose 6-dehydrogenase